VKYVSPDGLFVLRFYQNSISARAPPRTPLGEITTLHQKLSWWEGAGFPKNITLASVFGLAVAIRGLHRPVFLWSGGGNPNYNRRCNP